MAEDQVQEEQPTTHEPTVSPEENSTEEKMNPIRWVTLVVLFIAILVFVWYVKADRHTPITDLARIQKIVVPISPRVQGYLVQVNVRLHSLVKPGDTLFVIDQRPLNVALKKAEADVDAAMQQMGAGSADVKANASNVGVARASLDRAQRNYDRMEKVYQTNPGAVSQADRDRVETSLDQAKEKLASAIAKLERSEKQLGVVGPENPQLRAALTALEKAQLDLIFSVIVAEESGVIESFNVEPGYFCSVGQPIATFVSNSDVWVQADMRENNLSHIQPGDRVEYVLDVAPGQIFEAEVSSVGYGVSTSSDVNRGGLPQVNGSSGWLREPQRFPVIYHITDPEVLALTRSGGQVDVIVYSGDNGFLNWLGHIQIWFVSKLSYVR